MSVIAPQLQARIKELGIPRRAAARKCGYCSESDYSKFRHWVKGRNDPPADAILKICAGLEMTPDQLFGYQTTPKWLSDEEAALLQKFRALNATQRSALLTLIAVTQDITNLPFTGT